jgi:CRISPR-associated protein (TIGR02584 family)
LGGAHKLLGSTPRRVAFCLAGFSPAVVTETLYALALLRRPRIVPKRVVILTTADAYDRVVSDLTGADGAIRRLAREYRLPEDSLRCRREDVLVLHSRTGRPLCDIRSSADSRDAGEALAHILADLHADPSVELHCSLAGGRKTLGALLALALQMCARPGDRLYHVLVSEPFDRIPEFFYPPRRPRYYNFDGRRVHSSRARIDLAEVPLVRLGQVAESLGLGAEDLARRAAQVEAGVNSRFRPPSVVLDPGRRTIRIDGSAVHLPAQQFALYRLYAWLRQSCPSCRTGGRACTYCHPTDDEIFSSLRGRLLEMYEECRSAGGGKLKILLCDRSGTAASRDDFGGWLRQTRSKINRAIRICGPAGLVPGGAMLRRAEIPECARENRRGLKISPRLIRVDEVPSRQNQR